ncbi:MAG TPA: trypsin-like serine protease [Chloroflexi bacterium]|jgi:S1-C subfamily serine protease|nr:trypsin-like serine protease [Chloroflexota bacterium]
MRNRQWAILAAIGCLALVVFVVVALPLVFFLPGWLRAEVREDAGTAQATVAPEVIETQQAVPTFTPSVTMQQQQSPEGRTVQALLGLQQGTDLTRLYEQLSPGVVSIQVFARRAGQVGEGAGSGFIIDEQGHIVTNNHVVAGAQQVTVIYFNGIEARAEIVGTDDDSDLAVIRVDPTTFPEGVGVLPLGDSGQVVPGEWVVAIGNPFGLGGSLTLGIVSATGRLIPSGATSFAIPQAIQTDAAINPGNSGGPLLNLDGEVIGVNAQIATGGGGVNSGVGFAIPANVVRLVVPSLIATGSYQWPWMGVEGTSVNLLIQDANDLETQQGAYIDRVVPGSPAAQAQLQGSRGQTSVGGITVPTGGDVIIEANGTQIRDFADLLVVTAFRNVGDQLELTILRDGQEITETVTLAPRAERIPQ